MNSELMDKYQWRSTKVPYGAPSTVSRWLHTFWTERDRDAAPWLLALILFGFLLFGPQMVLLVIKTMPVSQLGNSGASIFVHKLIVGFASILAGFLGLHLLKLAARPSHLELSFLGIGQIWTFAGLKMEGNVLRWISVEGIRIEHHRKNIFGKPQAFVAIEGSDKAGKWIMRLELSQMPQPETREALCEAIARWAPKAVVDPNVFMRIKPPAEVSFTELWLQSMAKPPRAERYFASDAISV